MIVKVLFPFLIGVSLSNVLYATFLDVFYTAILAIFASFIYSILKDIKSNKKSFIKFLKDICIPIIIFSSFFSVGDFYANQFSDKLIVSKFLYSETKIEFIGYIKDIEDKLDGKYLTVITTSDISPYSKQSSLTGKILVSSMYEIERGNYVSVKGLSDKRFRENFTEDKPIIFFYESENLGSDIDFYMKHVEVNKLNKTNETYFFTIYKWIKEARDYLVNKTRNALNDPYGAVTVAITYGDDSRLSPLIKADFLNSGLIHIMVLSGFNVSLIIFIFWYLLSGFKTKFRVISIILFSIIFVFATGFHAPSVRALIMTNFALLGEFLGRPYSKFQSLILATFLITILNPITLTNSPSLHLSFLAVYSLIVVYPILEISFSKKFKSKFLINILTIFLAINLCITPYILSLTGKANLLSPLLSFIIEPIVITSTILTILLTCLVSLSDTLAQIISIPLEFLVNLILKISEFGSLLKTVNFFPNINFIILYYIILFSLSFYFYKKSDKENFILKQIL